MGQSIVWFTFLFVCGSLSDNDTGYFWHVTDFHYDQTYWTSQLSCNDKVPNPGQYGDNWCDSPWRLVQDTISNMAGLHPKVDFIIWTGDNVAHIKSDNLTLDINIEIIENVTRALNSSFTQVPVYASLGNHDFYPKDQADYNRSAIYDRVANLWQAWIRNQSDIEQFKEGGYYMARVTPKVRLLALNTILYFRSNKLTANVTDPAGQMAWLVSQLSEARSQGEKFSSHPERADDGGLLGSSRRLCYAWLHLRVAYYYQDHVNPHLVIQAAMKTARFQEGCGEELRVLVIVTGHVPPGLLTPGLIDWFSPKHKERFVNILLEHADVIVATHFGHDHSDGFKILQNKNGTNAVAQFTAPSVTPWRYKIPTATGDPHNPGVRLITYNRTTGAHLDYDQYYINITDSNKNNNATWAKLYSFKNEYEVSDMSVESLREIFSKMDYNKGTELSNKYCTHSLVSNYKIKCTDAKRAEIYCGGLKYDLTEALACKQKYLKDLNGAPTLYQSSYIVAIALVVEALMFMS